MPRFGKKILDRRQQIRTQTPPFLPDSFEILSFEQPRKKSLSEILRFLRLIAFASNEPVKRPPVGSAELFQRRFTLRRFALRCQHHAPMRSGKRDSAVLSTLTNRTPRRSVINRRHAPIQAKSRVMIKPAYLGGVTKGPRDSACSRFAARSDGVA